MAIAQVQPVYKVLDAKAGLGSKVVYDVKMGRNGLLYIAHQKGLSSFDGSRFIHYPNKSYPFVSVTNIMQLDNNTIWCRSFNGMLFQLANDSLIWEPKVPQFKNYMYAGAWQNYIIGNAGDSLFFYNSINRSLKMEKIPDTISSVTPQQICYATSNIYSTEPFTATSVVVDSKFHIYRHLIQQDIRLNTLFDMKSGHAVVVDNSLNAHLFSSCPVLFTGKNQAGLEGLSVNNTVVEDSIIWICATDGIYRINFMQSPVSIRHYLPDFNVSYICKDAGGTYFCSTIGNGIVMIPDLNVVRLPNSSHSNSVFALYKNTFFIGNSLGDIYRYDANTFNSQKLQKSAGRHPIEWLFYDTVSNALLSSSNIFVYIKNGQAVSSRFIVKDVCYINRNVLLLTNAGLYFIQNGTIDPELTANLKLEKKDINLSNLYVSNLFVDDKIYNMSCDMYSKTIAFYTLEGLFLYNYENGEFTKPEPPSRVLSSILIHHGELYVGTKDQGLFVLKQQKFVQCTDNAGHRMTQPIVKLYSYHDEVWVLAENGLFLYKNSVLTPFESYTAFQDEPVNDLIITDKTIYALTSAGIISCPKKNQNGVKYTPVLLINHLTNNGQEMHTGSPFEVSYNKNNVSVDFSLIAFAQAAGTHLAYRINNGEAVHLAANVRHIYLNNLAPDTYTISLIPVSGNEMLSGIAQNIIFTVNPPFWKSVWFIVVLILLASTIVWQIMQRVVSAQKKEFALKKATIQLESELNKSILSSIKSQMNPHFLFNALNTIQSYIYMNDKRSASIYISKFSDLTRSILEMSTKDSITIDEEVQSLTLYLELEKMRFEDSFNYLLQIDPDLNKDHTRIPAMLVQPYVENAIKHGLMHKKTNRELRILFKKDQNLLKIIIDDNGIGRKRSAELTRIRQQKHLSFAMNANKKRIEILKQTFKDIMLEVSDKQNELGEATGTQVIISLPL